MSGLIAALEGARHTLAGVTIALGVAVLVAGVAGQIRFPDFFTRLHGVALTPLASALILIGLAFESWDAGIALKLAMLALLFFALAPARTYMLANAAHGAGMAPLVGRLLRPSAESKADAP